VKSSIGLTLAPTTDVLVAENPRDGNKATGAELLARPRDELDPLASDLARIPLRTIQTGGTRAWTATRRARHEVARRPAGRSRPGPAATLGSDPTGWARFAEPHTRLLFEAVLAATLVTAGTRLLDAGCGSGLLLELAAARGAIVTGLDVSPGLLAAGRDRVPDAELWLGDLQELPSPNVFSARSPE
jgi:SAM-dependent methyltransferase